MLVLSRNENEKLYIGDDIVITVVELRGDSVRLGISAPRDVPIEREEIRKSKRKKQNEGEGSNE